MIDGFRQVYIHRATKKKILVKRIDCYEIVILDPESGEKRKSNRGELMKDYRYSKKDSNPARWQDINFTKEKIA